MTHLSCKYSHLILISLWTVFLIPIADWLHVLLLFPENSFNVSSLLHIQFTSSEELNYCDICLTNLTLPFPRHPFPSPAWSIPSSKHWFLAVHVSCSQSYFPLSPTISCTPSTSLTARKHSPQILYHTPV